MTVKGEMVIFAHLGLALSGQETAIEGWAALFVGILLVIIAGYLFFLARREGLYRW